MGLKRVKGEKCAGGKISKDRITVFMCFNSNGTEKLKLFVIGKSKSPQCFKNVKWLPIWYITNKESWMPSDLFESELWV
jgi:hypothetical protein